MRISIIINTNSLYSFPIYISKTTYSLIFPANSLYSLAVAILYNSFVQIYRLNLYFFIILYFQYYKGLHLFSIYILQYILYFHILIYLISYQNMIYFLYTQRKEQVQDFQSYRKCTLSLLSFLSIYEKPELILYFKMEILQKMTTYSPSGTIKTSLIYISARYTQIIYIKQKNIY